MKNNMLTIILAKELDNNDEKYQDLIIEIKNEIGKRHITELQKIARDLNIIEMSNNELEMMKIIAKYGHIVILNYGINNNKQSGIVILPKQITKIQLAILEFKKTEFFTDYESITSCAIPNQTLAYKGDLKQMKYEDKINGRKLTDAESLYYEIYNQAENLKKWEENNESNYHK